MQPDGIFTEINDDLEAAAREWQSVEALDEPVRDESIEEARKILRWLRNLQSTDMALEEWLEVGTLEQQAAKAGPLAKLAKIFLRNLRKVRKNRPNILAEDGNVQNGAHAAAALLQAVAEYFLNRLQENSAQEEKLENLISSLPPQADMRQSQPVRPVLETLALAFDRLIGRSVSDLSPAARLLEASQYIQASAQRLRMAEHMEPPEREDSIELARDMMQNFRESPLAGESLQSVIDRAPLEDKAAFAQAIEDIVDTYQNLLAEAGQFNSSLFQDPIIKDASGAAGVFSHAVKLMAAKEMPGSIAAAQQISAEATQTPEEWRNLHDRTVDRLVKSMQGGLEKAVGQLESQQQEENEDLAQVQDAIEAALNQTDQKHRKKKRRKKRGSGSSGGKSGAGGKKQRKQHLDLTADDYILKQGAFSRDAKTGRERGEAVMPGLSADALAAVRQLGGALKDLGKNISASLSTVSSGDKIIPDDKSIAQTHAEREKLGRNQGPGV